MTFLKLGDHYQINNTQINQDNCLGHMLIHKYYEIYLQGVLYRDEVISACLKCPKYIFINCTL